MLQYQQVFILGSRYSTWGGKLDKTLVQMVREKIDSLNKEQLLKLYDESKKTVLELDKQIEKLKQIRDFSMMINNIVAMKLLDMEVKVD